ncbi:uncharacterized protein [Pocillopora verrucosa]|uniref:uncharacterized protein isoform X4 n=1 Tax=Pocillopora verrucosa TaxID=203993 RepID=UPI003342D728
MVSFRDHQVYLLCLLLVKFHGLGGVDVRFTQEPSNPSYFKNDSDAKLVWDYTDPLNATRGIIFSVLVKDTYKKMIFRGSCGVQEHRDIPPSYQGRVKIEGRATLFIKNINPGDNTKFKCEMWGKKVESIVELTVAEALLINLSLGGKYFIEGSNATITCKASGKPPPYVSWIRNGVLESSGKKAASLEFDNINRMDTGQYTCQANNSMEVTSVNTTIVVHYKPEGARLTTNAPQNTVIKGDTVTFKCTVMAAVPQVSIYKFYFNGYLFSNNSNSEYTLNNVNRSQHHGEYKCVPHNAVGDGVEATVRLNINVPVQFTEVPQNITVKTSAPLFLSCDASGFPDPKIRWEKSGIKLSDTKQLNISSSNRNDAGEYVCIASNGVRQEKTVRAYVTVQYPPTIQNVTTSSKKSWIGQTVTLKCLSDGVPTPTLSWYKPEGSEINRVTARENKVQVPLRGDQDFGHYKCIAVNGLPPSDEKLIKINQIKKPGKASIKSESVIQATSITIQWTAPADDGGSPITGFQMILQKDGTEIKKVNITDPGTTSYSFPGLEKNTNYTVKLFSRNFVFEGDPTLWNFKTKFEGAPDVVEIDELPDKTTDDTITLKWKEPESYGKVIIMYTVYQRVVTDGKVGHWTEIRKIRDVSTRELKIALEKGKVYQFAITATNELGESLKQEKANIQQVKAEVSTEVYLTATIQEDCSRRSEVAAKFPEMACQIAFRFGCSSGNTVNTRCGSVVLDFMMRFNQTVVVSNVLIVLSDAARQDKFRGFKVNPDSIKQVLILTDGSESTTKGPEECNCPSNNVLLAIIGVLAFTVLLLIIYIIWLHKKAAVGKQRTYEDERRVCDNETLLEDIEPSLPDSRKLTQPHAEYMDLIEVNKDDRKAQSTPPGADYVPLHPLTRCWEVPRHNVTIEKIIGKGAFGQVAKGTAVGLRGSPETTTVAIKMLKTNATESDKRDLMKELDTMKQLKPHPYVIKLLGCVTESEQLLVLIEYVPFGDLLGYLRKSRGLKDTYYKDPDIKPQTNLTSQQLMKFAWQIADGMSYLSAKSIIHRDLAARNVLVGQKEMCKVTDFGMARDVQQENIYERKTKGRLPVKWTAYEALLYGKYTTKSDVWSYGVLLYEIFTIGGSPYPRMDGRKIANLLQDGYRMPKPQHVDEKLQVFFIYLFSLVVQGNIL